MVDASTRKDAKGKVVNGTLTTNVKADLLTARFAAKSVKTQMTGVDGTGRTVVERTLVDAGASSPEWKETGTGDALKVDFREDAKGKSELSAGRTQHGGVKIVREAAAAKPDASKARAAAEIEHAEGELAVYDADADRVTMTGGVKVSDAESALFADRVEMNRTTGDGIAEGSVRVSYLQQGEDRQADACDRREGDWAQGYGGYRVFCGAGWECEDVAGWVDGGGSGAGFRSDEEDGGGAWGCGVDRSEGGEDGFGRRSRSRGLRLRSSSSGPVRVLSREMVYTDSTREVEFRGECPEVNSQDGLMRSQVATAYLAPKDAAGSRIRRIPGRCRWVGGWIT